MPATIGSSPLQFARHSNKPPSIAHWQSCLRSPISETIANSGFNISIGKFTFVTKSASPTRRFVAWSLRIGALVLVGWAVSGSIRGALAQLSEQEWHVRPAWLCAAGVIYAAGLVPMGWFWQRTLAALGCPTPILPAMFAYFMGHIGKYVPGKAMSVILRVAVIRRWVPSMRIALISTLIGNTHDDGRRRLSGSCYCRASSATRTADLVGGHGHGASPPAFRRCRPLRVGSPHSD